MQCVNLVVNQGYGIAQAASAMQVGLSSMHRWVGQYKQEIKGVTPPARAFTLEQQRIQALEPENRQLKRDNYLLKKLPPVYRHRNASEQQVVALKLKKAHFNVTDICRHLKYARSIYYRRATPKAIDAEAVQLRAAVRHIHADVYATYGSRRMCVEINAQGFAVGRYKVRSLMQALQLKANRPKQHRYPVAGKPSAVAPNSLNRQFNPSFTNKHWTGDITYIRINQGWLYLAIVLDLY